ncbi:DEAD/DEAH box helicase [Aquabacterium lacunae]|nr:DEAD/DEAH box helicase [Aquabacterium lacunae]
MTDLPTPTMSTAPSNTQSTPFAALGLCEALLQAVTDEGYESPTPIQQQAIPEALKGRDVLATAQTGSGKTVAYVLPILQQLEDAFLRSPPPGLLGRGPHARHSERRKTHALVLVPTRELAQQVTETVQALSNPLMTPLRWGCLHGGVSINPQMLGLRAGADIVVATPGRLLDLIERNALRLDDVKTLVLDEADRLLDGGFADELERVLALLPLRKQTLMFSATFPAAAKDLAERLLHRPARIDVPSEPEQAPDITQRALVVDADKRQPLLRHLLKTEAWPQVLVFVATRHGCEVVADKLQRHGFAAAAFHADASQGTRREVLQALKNRDLQVVVATDLAARGIDIAQLPVVVNFDLARSADDHVHRIGRTGRAGASGLAVSFVPLEAEAHFRLIEKRQGQRVPREQVVGFEPSTSGHTLDSGKLPPGTGGIKGKRKSKKDKLREAAAATERKLL